MGRRLEATLVASLVVALAMATPWALANPDTCEYTGGGEVASGPGFDWEEDSYSCYGSLGTQSVHRYDIWINGTGPIGHHNVTYQSETDTGKWKPSWCYAPPGSFRCTETTIGVDGNNATARYRENGDASWCQYSFLVRRPTGGGASFALPVNDHCTDYLTMLP
jgi:hypothetical protein